MPAYRPRGLAALLASDKALAETEERLKCLLVRGDLSADAADEWTTINWLMRTKLARTKVKNALRAMES
jgi:hypothetical protein